MYSIKFYFKAGRRASSLSEEWQGSPGKGASQELSLPLGALWDGQGDKPYQILDLGLFTSKIWRGWQIPVLGTAVTIV